MKPSRNQRIQPATSKPSASAGRGRNQRIGQAPSATKKSPTPQQQPSTPATPATTPSTTSTTTTTEKKQKGWGAQNPHQKQILALATPSSSSDTSTETPIAPLFQPVYTETTSKRIVILGPGLVLLKDRIPLSLQREIVNNCIDFGDGKIPEVGGFYDGKLTTDKGFYDVELPSEESKEEEDEEAGWGAKKKLNMISKARITVPIEHYPQKFTDFALQCVKEAQDYISMQLEQQYAEEAEREEIERVVGYDDGKPKKDEKTIPTAEEVLPTPIPKFLLLNYYAKRGKIGWHYDRVPSLPANQQRTVRSPIISLSVGDSAEFLYKNQWTDPIESVLLESGDVLIFGGDSRMIYHMVPSINLGTTPKQLNLRHFPGRFNITIRQE